MFEFLSYECFAIFYLRLLVSFSFESSDPDLGANALVFRGVTGEMIVPFLLDKVRENYF